MSSLSSSKRTQQEFVKQLPASEKLTAAPKLLVAFAHGFGALFTGAMRSKESMPPHFFKYIHYSISRTMARIMTVPQLQVLNPPTDDAYEAACEKHGVKPDSLILDDGTRANWIGSSSAENIIIYLHGGGYVLPAGGPWFDFMFQVHDTLVAQKSNTSILFLSYDLAPAVKYPRQLQQAASLLTHVLNVMHKSPANIVIAGDSAGGNLVLSLMSHLSHPHPSKEIPVIPITLSAPLKAIVLMSPWVDFRITTDSFTRNATKDCLSQTGGQKWSNAFMGQKPPHPNADNYNQPIQAPASWWEGLKAEEVLVVGGKDEVLLDGIEEWVGTLQKVESLKGHLTVKITEGEGHDQPMMDIMMGYPTEGEQSKTVKDFLRARL